MKVKVTEGDEASVWVEGTLEFDTTGVSSVSAGGVALASEKAQFAALKVGYDNNADDDIDDSGDDLVVASPFGSTSITPTHDDNGNLTFDGSFKYTYDAWNRLVKATLDDEDVVIQAAEFDGLGRRIKKTVTNSGDLDGVTVYLYQGHQIIETRDGSDQVTLQVYHGTRYIDEVVGMRVADMGRVYVHQNANWNVTAMTDLTGRVVERYWYSPYGELEAHVVVHPFDYDDDGDVDDDDYDATTSPCTGTATGACRRLDADADGDVDAADQTIIAAYIATLDSDTELQRIPASTHSRRGNPFGHQGLVLDAELASYQNRARQYAPMAKRFMQRDPLVIGLGRREVEQRRLHFAVCDGDGTCRTRQKHIPAISKRAYRDGINIYASAKLSPMRNLDPSGLSVPCNNDDEKSLTCACDSGPKDWEVRGDSARARFILGGSDPAGCVTLLIPKKIFCTDSCEDIKGWHESTEDADAGTPIFDHECCHACAFEDGGLCAYLASWIPGDLTGHCDRNPKEATIHW